MEFVQATLTCFQLLNDTWSSICQCLNRQKLLNEKITTLRRKMETLKSREQDIKMELQNAEYQRGKREKKEVENWLIKAQYKKDEVQTIEDKFGKRRCFSLSQFLELIEKNIEEVDELVEQGRFPEGLLIDVNPDGGEALLTLQLIGETTAKKVLQEILTFLRDDEIASIGVYGMGGIGKTAVVTHIHNMLLQNRSSFGHVYWVTVSQGSSIQKLQAHIARAIALDLSEEEDERKRATLLFKRLQEIKKFVLILDDVWENYAVQEVGIPIGVDGGKLIVTTRLREVCLAMGCQQIIKAQLLSMGESWQLFSTTLGRYGALTREEEEIAKHIVEECAGLPLAIITTARSMRGVYDICEWRNALNELREHIKGHTINMEDEVYKILEFSYHRLNDKRLQECLLYCALFPEDYKIKRLDLISYWIVEGLVEEMETRGAEFDRGHAILNKLENACLLERCNNGKYVKMHDVIRDMTINMSTKNFRFMVKAGRGLMEREWSKKLERVSLMYNPSSSLIISPPKCPKLSTLLLQYAYTDAISKSFFVHMETLQVLNLSGINVAFLPDSISGLVNLRALILRRCGEELTHLPSLAKLKNLKELDLKTSMVEKAPDGVEKLVNLKHLDLRHTPIGSFPLTNLFHLQCLRVDGIYNYFDVQVERLVELRHLEVLGITFPSLHKFNSYVREEHYSRLTHYSLHLKTGYKYREIPCRHVGVLQWDLRGEGQNQLLLPTNVEDLEIKRCQLPSSLLDAMPSLQNATDLETCRLEHCRGIEYLWLLPTSSLFHSLKTLVLNNLSELRVLFKYCKPPPPPPTNFGSFSNLKMLTVGFCNKLKYMFTTAIVKHHLQNLQSVDVLSCLRLEDIIVASEEDGEEEIQPGNCYNLSFHNLKSLQLQDLPKLKNIWKGTMVAASLERICIMECEMLKRIPLSICMTDGDGQRGAPISTPKLFCEKRWWDLLERDTNIDANSVFQPLHISWHQPMEDWEESEDDYDSDV